jgi:GNAT superfamily N-acetyltransferase
MSISLTQELIHVPGAPEIPGLTFRRFLGASDYPKIVEIFNACKEIDGIEHTLNEEDIAHNYEHLERSDPFTDMVFAEVDGETIAYSRVGWYQESQGDYIYYALGWIHPDWRRKGIGTAILKHNERRLREIAAEHPDSAIKWFQNDHNDVQVDVAALLKGNNYEPVRWGYEMTRPIGDPVPEAPMPAGLEVRLVKKEHYRLIHEAANEAFRDHWGHSESTEEDYQRWLAWPHINPKLWKVAWDGDQVAGMVLNWSNPEETKEYGRKRGWTDPICVRGPWRRHGLARSLLVQSVLMFREIGFDETALGVDTQNPNHALNLYEGVGYKMVRKGITYRKRLD